MARALLRPPGPCLVAIGGFSGTGKSTLGLGLAPSLGAVPGAVVMRSDEIRKRLAGVPLLQRLGPDGYSPAMSERVYAAAIERARTALRQGYSAVVDAVFARPSDRDAIERLARDLSVPFAGIWLEAPEPVLVARTEQRRNDPSDANAEVIRMQRREPTGAMTWHRLDVSTSPASVLREAWSIARIDLGDLVNAQPPETE
jgi:predicted kinase